MSDALWTSDFIFNGRQLTVRKTGAVVRIDREVLASAASWLAFYLPIRLRAALHAVKGDRRPAVWFAPDQPRPWYLVWAAMAWAGVRIAERPTDADAAFYFEDATHGRPPKPRNARPLNFECLDVSKSHVAAVFEQVFGYPLALDPARHRGLAVEKSEANGVHDGCVVACPRPAKPARVYQRLIDNREGGDQVVDLRTPFVGGKPVLVFVKRRPIDRRFANYNSSVSVMRPQQLFSTAELERLEAFAKAMKLDWGGLDILRDLPTNRIYVVDVNKTDMPPLALPWRDKLRAVSRLAAAFERLITEETQP
ncbi:MAG TPA: hypothetical protein VFE13_03950 [Caulobacteraceae bacterium]|nr:hypothetical protein [Caulobacteraceae bacterium]